MIAPPIIGRRDRWLDPNGQYEVDWSHPLAQGLAVYVVPAQLRDLCGLPVSIATGSIAPVGTAFGIGGRGANARLSLPVAPFNSGSFTGGVSLVACGQNFATSDRVAIGMRATTPILHLTTVSSTSVMWRTRNEAGSLDDLVGAVNTAAPQVCVGTMTAAGSKVLYGNGRVIGSSSTYGTFSNFSNFELYGDAIGSGSSSNTFALLALYRRALSAQEVTQLSERPFQMLRRVN